MSKDFRNYFLSNNKELQEAFLDGYIAALKRHKVYDPALFLEGHQLQTHVAGDLIAQEKRAEDAARSQARIVSSSFNNNCTATEAAREYIMHTADVVPLRPTSDAINDLIADIICNLPKGLEEMPPITLPSGEKKSAVEIVTSGIRKYIEVLT